MRWLALPMVALASLAHAEPTVIRLATVAPEGTSWARELRGFGRDVEQVTHGLVRIKWYMGGIAGDENEVIVRVQRGQLDGFGATLACERLAPSLRVMRAIGAFQSQGEQSYVISMLRPIVNQEFARAGFVDVGFASFGTDILFTRTPVRSLDQLRKQRLWIWDSDEVMASMAKAMHLSVVPLPVAAARAAYEDGRIDGFVGLPASALAFQWTAHVRYFSDLRVAALPACMVIASRAFDRLPLELKNDVRSAAAKFSVRLEDVGRSLDEQLIGGLFEKQGLERVPVGDELRVPFLAAARDARRAIAGGLVPSELLDKVQIWLADYRAEHPH
jgi:TRAP-type C4-dicarboxylate transport system substrate-binding protein